MCQGLQFDEETMGDAYVSQALAYDALPNGVIKNFADWWHQLLINKDGESPLPRYGTYKRWYENIFGANQSYAVLCKGAEVSLDCFLINQKTDEMLEKKRTIIVDTINMWSQKMLDHVDFCKERGTQMSQEDADMFTYIQTRLSEWSVKVAGRTCDEFLYIHDTLVLAQSFSHLYQLMQSTDLKYVASLENLIQSQAQFNEVQWSVDRLLKKAEVYLEEDQFDSSLRIVESIEIMNNRILDELNLIDSMDVRPSFQTKIAPVASCPLPSQYRLIATLHIPARIRADKREVVEEFPLHFIEPAYLPPASTNAIIRGGKIIDFRITMTAMEIRKLVTNRTCLKSDWHSIVTAMQSVLVQDPSVGIRPDVFVGASRPRDVLWILANMISLEWHPYSDLNPTAPERTQSSFGGTELRTYRM